MNMNKFQPLQNYLNTLPEPVALYERFLCWWSDIIDNITILKWQIKKYVGESR